MATRTRGLPHSIESHSWLGQSEMAGRILAFDWAATSVGPIDTWPQRLLSAVSICLHSRFQMAIYWGPELNCLYNDAESMILGDLHPKALGTPARELLRDSWQIVGPKLEAVMLGDGATWAQDEALTFNRRGSLEVGYFTYSYSPLFDDHDDIGGVLLVSQETTPRVVAEQRLEILQGLVARTMDASTTPEACRLAVQALERAGFPFALIYLMDERGECAAIGSLPARRARSGRRVSPKALARRDAGALLKMLADSGGKGALLDTAPFLGGAGGARTGAARSFATTIGRSWSEPVIGFLVVGLSGTTVIDPGYRDFLELLALGVGRSVAAARAREAEHHAAEARGRERERALRENELRAVLANLRDSQRRVAAAADSERRRIESNLHDGAQQRLMAIRLELGLLEEQAEQDPGATRAELHRLHSELNVALQELRELAHGLNPPLLASDGLVAALSAAASRAAIAVSVEARDVGRMPRAIESAAYFWCLEALQNVAKHGGRDAQAILRLAGGPDLLTLSVSDDGIGFDTQAPSEGHGLANLRDRLAAVGGAMTIASAPGQGTTVTGRIPLSSLDMADTPALIAPASGP